MKFDLIIAMGAGGAFVLAVNFATHADLHLPPGNAPITVTAQATANSTTTVGHLNVLQNSIHDAEYAAPADTAPLKSDGQTEVT